VTCPECRRTLHVAESSLGGPIACPECEHRFTPKAPARKTSERPGGSFEPASGRARATDRSADESASDSKPPLPRVRVKVAAKERAETDPFAPRTTPRRCPACRAKVAADAVLCVGCGWDFQRKRKLETAEFAPASGPEKYRVRAPDESESWEEVTWGRIIAGALDPKFVLGEALELTAWRIFFAIIFVIIAVCLIMISPYTVLMVSAAIAAMLRLWMAVDDIGIMGLLKTIGALIILGMLCALGGRMLLSVPEEWMGLVTFGLFLDGFLGGAILIILVRMVSFFFGRYFALFRRSALMIELPEEEHTGFNYAVPGIVISLLGFAPVFALYITGSVFAVLRPGWFTSIEFALWLGVTLFAALWTLLYVPMAIGVFATEHSLNPITVLSRIGRIAADYLVLIILWIPFVIVVGLLGLSWPLLLGLVFDVEPPWVLVALGSWLVMETLDEYTTVVVLHTLALVFRRNESSLKWRKKVRRLHGV
jgi:hypothetical protein